jgi:hypothetical protein
MRDAAGADEGKVVSVEEVDEVEDIELEDMALLSREGGGDGERKGRLRKGEGGNK